MSSLSRACSPASERPFPGNASPGSATLSALQARSLVAGKRPVRLETGLPWRVLTWRHLAAGTMQLTLPRTGGMPRMTHGERSAGEAGSPSVQAWRWGSREDGPTVVSCAPSEKSWRWRLPLCKPRHRRWKPARRPVHRLGEQVFDAVAEIGDVAHFSVLTLVWIVRRRSRWSVLVPIFYAIGVKSVSVVAITGTFIGMVLAVQAYHQFAMMGLATRLGSVINISIVKELGPVLAATMLAGRVGSSDGRRAGHDARHRADRRPVGAGDQPHLLPGRAAVPGLRPADPAA